MPQPEIIVTECADLPAVFTAVLFMMAEIFFYVMAVGYIASIGAKYGNCCI
jgi:hypothetical protein